MRLNPKAQTFQPGAGSHETAPSHTTAADPRASHLNPAAPEFRPQPGPSSAVRLPDPRPETPDMQTHSDATTPPNAPPLAPSPVLSPQSQLRKYIDYSDRNNNNPHPNVPTRPTGPDREMSPSSSAFKNLASYQFDKNPGTINEQATVGRLSPGGTTMGATYKDAVIGDPTGVDYSIYPHPIDTHIAHTHTQAGRPFPSTNDQLIGADNPQTRHLMKDTPTGEWYGFSGQMSPGGKTPQFHGLSDPYKPQPINFDEGYPETKLPTDADRYHS